MVRTGASSYIRYDWEDTFGTAAFTDSTDKAFGLQQRLTSFSLNHSRKDLPALNQVEIDSYAYGQQNGSLGVDFVLSNPWIFRALYGAQATTGSGPYVHTWGTTGDVSGAKTITPFSVEVGFAAEGPPGGSPTNIVRQAKGCILNNLDIGCAIDDTVNCSAGISYGSEADNGTTYHSSPPADDVNFPYTFAHGELRWYDSGGDTDAAGSVVAQLQSANISFAQNPALLYSIGSNRSVAAFRRVFDITGSFTASWVDNRQLLQLLDQIEKPLTKSYIREGVAGAAVDAVLTFDNGGSGTAKKAITLKLSGVSPDSLSIEGIAPVEPVFENISWRAKTASVVADNNIATAL